MNRARENFLRIKNSYDPSGILTIICYKYVTIFAAVTLASPLESRGCVGGRSCLAICCDQKSAVIRRFTNNILLSLISY
ncbi:hypothetical protein RIR_jg26108.t1 [Rhizophagus irregularis DAOM 181602=DAOM 197198]|nr:hypothetical protein RIR_jg26108.t1 [Rhizophagus irregularis DAOM 181602=DAOM 197198]